MHDSIAPVRSLIALVACAGLLGGCKNKGNAQNDTYVPPPRKAFSSSELMSLCEGGKPFPGNAAYEKKSAPTSPSKVAVFRKYLDDKSPAYKADEHEFGAIDGKKASPASIELVACVELKRKGEPLFCTYYGAKIELYDMTHTVKVLEASTGKVLSEQIFELDRRTEKCAGLASGSGYRGTDYSPKLLSILLPLEPEGVELPKVNAADLDAVCSGSAFPQAAPLSQSGRHPVHVVYFPTADRSFTRADLPKGLEMAGPPKSEAGEVQLVACVTGMPKKKAASCNFTGGKVLELSEGDFAVSVYEAHTGKLVETKTFPGTSGGCPASYEFFGSVDKVMTKISPQFGTYLQKLAGD